ncbi:dGTPase [Antricoccus suffuscus]|uniref:Deoxyguanosinetriphosphate triphosphohydrolase-like protein n=1 Tax=Antricoccus suffuscus TaxID=1629062 RepID=A0A2T0Z4V0_9ACTN|nr:deoxyguanosinetriphosphate triphosphohydrolase [Antricoccus suffuscus]PRZ31366.1 dGTPase [Antricoccus suffuscus]
MYADADRQRLVVEPAKASYVEGSSGHWRSEFARDRARILHSSALRRLAGKTQVVVPFEDDFPRTRLTHSLEVAQIAREIGQALGLDPDITDAAGLAHDLGHPPFGHNGEDALNAISGEAGGFEGNAQTLRVLVRLEAKIVDGDIDAGLNLTRAVLDATCKYPWPRRDGSAKFGFYADDAAAFGWMRRGAPEGARCIEAQVMDWSDDVAYSVHDLEDGITSGLIDLRDAANDDTSDDVCRIAARYYIDADTDYLAATFARLLAFPVLREVASYGRDAAASRSGRVALKRATSELLGRFSSAAVTSTRARYGDAPLARYGADLVVPAQVAAECALLKACAFKYVMQREGADTLQRQQREIITGLATVLRDCPEHLRDQYADAHRRAVDDAGRLRAVIDQIAELTDGAAIAWHRRLCGN